MAGAPGAPEKENRGSDDPRLFHRNLLRPPRQALSMSLYKMLGEEMVAGVFPQYVPPEGPVPLGLGPVPYTHLTLPTILLV